MENQTQPPASFASETPQPQAGPPPLESPPILETAPRSKAPRVVAIGAVAVVIALSVLLAVVLPGRLNGTTSAASDPTKTGCPSAAAAPHWPQAANETLTQTVLNQNTSAAVGDTLEFDLPTGFRWNLESAPRTMQTLAPAGYYDPTLKDCVWRLKATSAGQSEVTFTRQPLCLKNTLCPPIIINYTFAVTVH